MKALILAAGQGTRLKKYTQNLPKGMLVFHDQTIIEHQIKLYRECGIDDIIIVRGFAADKINYDGIRYYCNDEYATTNMVVSLLTAKLEFDDEMIVSYSDILFEKALLEAMIAAESDYCAAVDDQWKMYWKKRYGKIDFDTESLVIDSDNNITSLGFENPPLNQISARYIGLLKFSKAALDKILAIWNRDYTAYQFRPWQQSGKFIKQAYMTDLLNALIQDGKKIKAVHFNNGWIEFDTNEDYERAYEWLKDDSISQIINITTL